MSHTPTPWFAVNIGSSNEPMWAVKAERIRGRGPTHEVAICATGDSPQAMEKANAVFIVEAVNSHDRLTAEVARLRDALAAIASQTSDGWAADLARHTINPEEPK